MLLFIKLHLLDNWHFLDPELKTLQSLTLLTLRKYHEVCTIITFISQNKET